MSGVDVARMIRSMSPGWQPAAASPGARRHRQVDGHVPAVDEVAGADPGALDDPVVGGLGRRARQLGHQIGIADRRSAAGLPVRRCGCTAASPLAGRSAGSMGWGSCGLAGGAAMLSSTGWSVGWPPPPKRGRSAGSDPSGNTPAYCGCGHARVQQPVARRIISPGQCTLEGKGIGRAMGLNTSPRRPSKAPPL